MMHVRAARRAPVTLRIALGLLATAVLVVGCRGKPAPENAEERAGKPVPVVEAEGVTESRHDADGTTSPEVASVEQRSDPGPGATTPPPSRSGTGEDDRATAVPTPRDTASPPAAPQVARGTVRGSGVELGPEPPGASRASGRGGSSGVAENDPGRPGLSGPSAGAVSGSAAGSAPARPSVQEEPSSGARDESSPATPGGGQTARRSTTSSADRIANLASGPTDASESGDETAEGGFGEARVTIFPGVAEASVGSVVPVHVSIVGGRDVASVPFHLMFDPQVLRFQSAAEGKFLGADGNSTAFLVGPDSSGSRVVVGQARLGQVPGVSGGGDLCVIFFDVVGPGEPSLAIERAGVIQSSGRRQPSFFDVRPLTVK